MWFIAAAAAAALPLGALALLLDDGPAAPPRPALPPKQPSARRPNQDLVVKRWSLFVELVTSEQLRLAEPLDSYRGRAPAACWSALEEARARRVTELRSASAAETERIESIDRLIAALEEYAS